MALAEPEAEPSTAAKVILNFCGQDPEKPLLLLGGVYNRQLVTAMDIEVRRRAASLHPRRAPSLATLSTPPASRSMPLAATHSHATGRGTDTHRPPNTPWCLAHVRMPQALAKLPANEQVYAELAGAVSMDGLKMGLLRAMKSPTDGVAAVQHMEQPAQGLVSLLERWTEQRGGGDAEGQAP